jgi:hypothetical protein
MPYIVCCMGDYHDHHTVHEASAHLLHGRTNDHTLETADCNRVTVEKGHKGLPVTTRPLMKRSCI